MIDNVEIDDVKVYSAFTVKEYTKLLKTKKDIKSTHEAVSAWTSGHEDIINGKAPETDIEGILSVKEEKEQFKFGIKTDVDYKNYRNIINELSERKDISKDILKKVHYRGIGFDDKTLDKILTNELYVSRAAESWSIDALPALNFAKSSEKPNKVMLIVEDGLKNGAHIHYDK